MKFSATVIGLLSFSATTVSATGGWFTSCFSPLTIPDGSYFLLLAYCPGGTGPQTMGSINLDACFSNDNGTLVPHTSTTESGFASGGECSTNSCSLASGTSILSCSCANDDGVYGTTTIDTNLYVANGGGELVCLY